MTPERWQKIKSVLEKALELAPDERSDFLDRSCPTDQSLRQEVETLLGSSDEARSSFLESSTLQVTLTTGTKLGEYEVQKLIGSGGMGEVYRARDVRLHREVAIKVLPSFLSSDKERLRRFEQEAQAAAALNHPNILAVFQMGTYQGAPYLVSELLEGETLREEIKRGPLPSHKVIEQGVQIAHGLAAAHEKGIVHRDLKPENVFSTRDGRIKILDFGLAKLKRLSTDTRRYPTPSRADTESRMVMGTAGYMSPEQVRGKAADHRTDIFSFGAILYEMLTGQRAFHKTTSAETMSAILNEEPRTVSQIAKDIPPALQRTVHRCLEKSPEQRFQSASDLAFALEALSDSGSATHPLPVPHRLPAFKWLITAAGAIAIAVGLILWWLAPSGTPLITGATQLTDDGKPKEGTRLLTDGSRIYFNEGEHGSLTIAEISVAGGQTAEVESRFVSPQIVSLSRDGSSLLSLVGTADSNPLWLIPLPLGEPRRVGEIKAFDATFFPDGRIAFTQGNALFGVEKDGSKPEELVNFSRPILAPNISPDGQRIGVTLCCDHLPQSLAEILVKRRSQEPLETDPNVPSCCSTWTPDGRYLLFQSLRDNRWDLWVLRDRIGVFGNSRVLVPLTNGPLSYTNPIVSRDGRRIFAVGTKRRGELTRYDEKSAHFVPYLSGISAADPTFSRDGKWVAYRSYPDGTLWRSRTDGTERLQLTYAPISFPVISPDGSRVAFEVDTGTTFDKGGIYIVSTQGGSPQRVADSCTAATWSPNSNLLVLSCWTSGKQPDGTERVELRIADVFSGKISPIRDSEGKCCAFWADQHTIVAALDDQTKFFTFDLTVQKWIELASGLFVNWFISPDGKYLNYTTGGTEPAAHRLRLSNRSTAHIVDLKGFRRAVDSKGSTQLNVAPDGSLLFTRDIGSQEIYALDVKWP